jgi:ArsR family transcriptional regulator
MATVPVVDVRADEPISVDEAQALAAVLQTLGDPTRLRILTTLETTCVSVTSIVEATGLRQPSVSHHLRILRDRGLVRGERRGGYVYYCLTTNKLRAALDALRVLTPGTAASSEDRPEPSVVGTPGPGSPRRRRPRQSDKQ